MNLHPRAADPKRITTRAIRPEGETTKYPTTSLEQIEKGLAAGAIQVITPRDHAKLLSKLDAPMPGLELLELPAAQKAAARATYVEKGLGILNNLHQVYVDTPKEYMPVYIHVLPTDAAGEEIQKGILGEAFQSSNALEVKKKGSAITEAITARLPGLEATANATRSAIDTLLAGFRVAPERPVDRWDYRGYTIPAEDAALRTFSWEARYWPDAATTSQYDAPTPSVGTFIDQETGATKAANPNAPISAEEARQRELYNELVSTYLDQRGEACLLGTLSRNLDPETSYPLSTAQLQALGF